MRNVLNRSSALLRKLLTVTLFAILLMIVDNFTPLAEAGLQRC